MQQQPKIWPLAYFDDIRFQSAAITGRMNNNGATDENLVIESGAQSTLLNVNNGTMRLGHLVSLGMISAPAPADSTMKRVVLKRTIEVEMSTFLGIHHFNQRSGAVIAGLPDRLKDCNVYFTMDFRDSYGSPEESSRQLFDSVTLDTDGKNNHPFPTGILGTGRSSTAAPTSILGGVFKIPQVSCCATSRSITRDNAPLFTRTIPTNQQDAIAAAEYLSRSLGLSHVGVLFEQGPYGEQFAADFRVAANALDVTVVSAGFYVSNSTNIDDAIRRIRKSQVRYIFGIFYESHLRSVMKSADHAGMVGNGYTWLFSESLLRLAAGSSASFDKDEDKEVIKAVNGSGVLLLSIPPNDRFNQALHDFRADPELQDYYVSRHTSTELFDGYNLSESDSAQPIYFAQLAYDAAVAVGLAACEIELEFPNGVAMFESLEQIEFEGSSGHVEFNGNSASRSRLGLQFSMMNVKVEEPDENGKSSVVAQAAASIDFLTPEVIQQIHPFVYADGSTEPPPSLPEIEVELNKIPGFAVAFGLVLCAFLMLMSLGWILWVLRFRKKQTVRAAQPLFLVMLSMGALILASSIIPMGFQEPMTSTALDVGCMAVPWLVSIGFTTSFLSLFSKLWRIGRLLGASAKFRKVDIKAHHVILPFLILAALNVALLISWTVITPLRWERLPDLSRTDSFGRSIESNGGCHGTNTTMTSVFTWSLIGLNFLSLTIAIIQSYRTRNIASMFNESHHVSLSLLSMMEASVVGLPLLWVVSKAPTANYLVRTIMVTIFCIAITLPIFLPKAKFQRNQQTGRLSIDVVVASVAQRKATFNNHNVPSFSTNGVSSSIKRYESSSLRRGGSGTFGSTTDIPR